MCFDRDSLPPIPAISGAAVSHDELVLEARDGNRLAAFAATPDEPSGAGIVILPDIRGLYRFYEELALRFAERGHAAVAIDYFGRTAGVSKRDDEFECRPHVQQTTPAGVQADTAAGAAWLRDDRQPVRSSPSASASAAATPGWPRRQATGSPGRSASTAGPARAQDGSPGPAQRAGELGAPILGLMGGADEGIPVDQVRAFEQALVDAGVEHEIVVYDGAPHSFFDRKQEQFADASADAWSRVLAFVEQYSG